MRRTVEAAVDLEIASLAVYAFSTENWARPPDEVESVGRRVVFRVLALP